MLGGGMESDDGEISWGMGGKSIFPKQFMSR